MVRGALFVGAVAAALTTGCKRDDSEPVRQLDREGDAALVVIVDRAASGVTLVDEEEPNDDVESAQLLSLPGGVRGHLDGEIDVDHYRIAIDEPSQLKAIVTGADDADLILDVLDEEGELIVRSDRAPAGTSEGVPNLALEPGEYIVKIHEFVRGREAGEGDRARQGMSEPYELVVELAQPEPGYEQEPNEDIETATELELDRDALGYLGWHRDVDVWRVSLAGLLDTDGLDIVLQGVPWVTPKLELLSPSGEVLLERSGRRGEGIAMHNVAPHHALAEKADRDALYVRVSGGRSNPEEPYRLRVTRRDLDPESELEPNHEPALATPLRDEPDELEGQRAGHLDLGDVDTYRLGTSPGQRTLFATVEPSSGVRATLQAVVDGEVVAETEASGRGAEAMVADVDIPAGRDAHVVVRGDSADAMGGGYRLRWSLH